MSSTSGSVTTTAIARSRAMTAPSISCASSSTAPTGSSLCSRARACRPLRRRPAPRPATATSLQRLQELLDVLLHRALVGDAQPVGGDRRIRKRCLTHTFDRVGRDRSGAGYVVGHVRSDIQIQSCKRLLQIVDFGIDLKFRRAGRQVAAGTQAIFQCSLERFVGHARPCQRVHWCATGHRAHRDGISVFRQRIGYGARADRHRLLRCASSHHRRQRKRQQAFEETHDAPRPSLRCPQLYPHPTGASIAGVLACKRGRTVKDDIKDARLSTTALRNIAAEAAGAFNNGPREIQPFTARYPDLTIDDAYHITARANEMRVAKGYRPVGRKIGFTNRRIWGEYDVHAPVWGYVYDRTLHDLATPLPLAPYSDPKIEPEIMFGLARAPSPGMDDAALLTCVAWVAHGYEMVQSIYPGWKFAQPDAVIVDGHHAALLIGPRHGIGADAGEWLRRLTSFEVELFCDGKLMDKGHALNVLEGPL